MQASTDDEKILRLFLSITVYKKVYNAPVFVLPCVNIFCMRAYMFT